MSKLCGRCGAENPPDHAVCGTCGGPLAAPSQPLGKQTMLGFGVPNPVPPGNQTGTPPASEAPKPSMKTTLLGFPAQPPSASQTGSAPGPAPRSFQSTMLGMPAPTPASASNEPANYPTPPPPPASAPPQSSQPQPPSVQIASQHKTMLGVARPGIAPLNPGQPKPLPLPPVSVPEPPSDVPQVAAAPPVPVKKGVSGLAATVIVVASMLLTAAVLAVFFHKGRGDIEARPRLDAQGKEELELDCASCEDGTVVRHATSSVEFRGRRAVLPLAAPLRVGENVLSLTLKRPSARDEDRVELKVPVQYRVRGETKGLEQTPPKLAVLVAAVAGTKAVVDGKELAVGPSEVRYDVDVAAELTGAEAQIKRLEKRIPYTVTPPDGMLESGSVTLQLAIVPLVIDAPGDSVVIDKPSFVLAGRTAKGARVTVGGAQIGVDAEGRFAQVMNVSAPGETTIVVRADLAEHAPRLFPIRVRRVESIAQEAERLRPTSESSYARLATSAVGTPVALDGSVIEARVDGHVTRMLLDVKSGCASSPCLAKVSYAAESALAAGSKVSVFGKSNGMVDGPRTGTKIPDIVAAFVLKGKR